MLTKINRQECIKNYPTFPLRDYDYSKDEEVFSYPNVFKSYVFTLRSKTFKGHIKQLGIQLSKLIESFQFEALIFLGDTELSWLNQNNEYKPAKEAQEYLQAHKIGKRFNGGLKIGRGELPSFVKHLGWLTRCNASLPYFHFVDADQNILGHICKYGNLHIDTLNLSADKQLTASIKKTNFKYLDSSNCYNQFGKTSRIPGRRIIV
jgi:hypothetical protein